MRFTSVGPKWRAALRSSLSPSLPLLPYFFLSLYLSLSASLRLTHAYGSLRFPALSDTATPLIPLPALCICRYLSLLVSLSFSLSLWSSGARGRLQECTKCTVLTDARPCSTASTCLLRPFSFASPRSFPHPISLSLSRFFAVLHYFFL